MSAPGPGHNEPPPPTLDEKLKEDNADLIKRAADIEAGIDRFIAKFPKIETDEADAIATSFIGRNGVVTTLLKVSDARRVEQVEPFLSGQRTVNGFYKGLLQELQTPDDGSTKVKTLKAMVTAYKLEKDRKEREAAQKLADEAAAKARLAEAEAAKTLDDAALDKAAEAALEAETLQQAAAAPAAAFTRSHGIGGAVSSLRTTWKLDEAASDLMELAKAVVAGKAPLDFLAFNSTRIGVAIRSEKLRECPGLAIIESKSV